MAIPRCVRATGRYTDFTDGPIVDLPIGPGGSIGRGGPPLKRVKPKDLFPDPDSITVGTAINTRLDWVGRNHGSKHITNGQDIRKTNFPFCDGHVETKHITETPRAKIPVGRLLLQPAGWRQHRAVTLVWRWALNSNRLYPSEVKNAWTPDKLATDSPTSGRGATKRGDDPRDLPASQCERRYRAWSPGRSAARRRCGISRSASWGSTSGGLTLLKTGSSTLTLANGTYTGGASSHNRPGLAIKGPLPDSGGICPRRVP